MRRRGLIPPVLASLGLLWCSVALVAAEPQTSPAHAGPAVQQSRVDQPFLFGSLEKKTPIDRNPGDPLKPRTAAPGTSLGGTLVVLGGVVLLILVGGWAVGRRTPQRRGGLSAAVQCWGTQPLTPQLAIHLVQVGERLLVLGSGSDGLRTLAEITDPGEAAHLLHLCRAESPPCPTFGNVWDWLWGRRRGDETAGSAAHSDRVPRSSARGSASSREQSHASAATAPRPAASRTLHTAGIVLALVLSGSSLVAQEPGRGVIGLGATPFSPLEESPRSVPLPVAGAVAPRPAGTPWEADALERSPHAASSPLPPHAGHPLPAVTPETPATSRAAGVSAWLPPGGWGGMLQWGLLIGVVSLAPAILLMTTCYVRIIVVLGLLRQGLGVSQFPPTQVLTALALFLTALVMWPVWSQAYSEGIAPYARAATADEAALQAAFTATLQPVRGFMSRQIEATGNTAALDLFLEYQSGAATAAPAYYEDVPIQVLLPAYVLSELRTAFLIGFQIYLPFLVIDLVTSSVLAAVGLQLLSPGVVALPFKLLLFVLVDGWHLTVELLLRSIAPAV